MEIATIKGEKPTAIAEKHPSDTGTEEAAGGGHAMLVTDDTVKIGMDEGETEVFDLWKPLPPVQGLPEEHNVLTIRALVVGTILGSLVNAANIYLGLKTGFGFGAAMFGAIFGFGIIKACVKSFAGAPIIGMPFGPQENSILQACATGASGLGSLFIGVIPAMYQLNLLSERPQDDIGRIITLAIICSFFGLFFAIPLRKFFIVHVAKELQLSFPSATAIALTIQSMHGIGSGSSEATKKVKALGWSLLFAFVLRIVSAYATGILWDWHIFTWFFIWGNYSNWAINVENWGWFIEWTPAFIGSGFLVGLNVGISYFIGTFFAWGFLGPILVHYGICQGRQLAPDDPKWSGVVSFTGLGGISDPNYVPSPRYWFLWPGVLVLLCYSIAEFFASYRVLWQGITKMWTASAASINAYLVAKGRSRGFLCRQAREEDENATIAEDFATKEEQVPIWVWVGGVITVLILTVIIFEVQFNINGGLGILGSFLAVLFSFLVIHAVAVTNISPVSSAGKISQLVFGGVTQGMPITQALTTNLISGAIASGGADMSSTLIGDFRVGYLLRTPPKQQFYAQAFGCFIAMFLAPGIFLLFAAAYPCILRPNDFDRCEFSVPSVAAWRAIAEAVVSPNVPIPLSSGIFAIVLSFMAILQVVFRRVYLVGEREKYQKWLPNWMSIGIAFVIPQTQYSTALTMGAILSKVWRHKSPKTWNTYCYAIAAGAIAGEGIAGVVNAGLALGNVGGSVYGTNIGCPQDSC